MTLCHQKGKTAEVHIDLSSRSESVLHGPFPLCISGHFRFCTIGITPYIQTPETFHGAERLYMAESVNLESSHQNQWVIVSGTALLIRCSLIPSPFASIDHQKEDMNHSI